MSNKEKKMINDKVRCSNCDRSSLVITKMFEDDNYREVRCRNCWQLLFKIDLEKGVINE